MAGKISDPKLVEQISQGISSQGWIHVPGVLSNEQLKELNRFFERRANDFRLASVIDQGRVVEDERIRGDRFLVVDPKFPPPEFTQIKNFLDQLHIELNIKLHLGIVEYQCHPSIFPATFFFRKHIDAYGEEASHVVSYVFYIHESWAPSEGGALILYDQDNHPLAKVMPEPGSFIAFKSRDFPHEVKTCFRERRSITGWFHNRPVTLLRT